MKKNTEQFRFLNRIITHPVAGEILLLVLLLAGIVSFFNTQQETSPQFSIDVIEINVEYNGASPTEIERAILLPIETQLQSIYDIKQVVSEAQEGLGVVFVESHASADINTLLVSVKNAIDQIQSFPAGMDTPQVSIAQSRETLMEIGVYGLASLHELYRTAHQLRLELLQGSESDAINIHSAYYPEIVIDVNRAKLQTLDLTFADIKQAITANAKDVAFTLLSEKGLSTSLRGNGRSVTPQDFQTIEVPLGQGITSMPLGELADIGYRQPNPSTVFEIDGKPAILLSIYKPDSANPLALSEETIAQLEKVASTFPPGVKVKLLEDASEAYAQRLTLLAENGAMGFCLVLVILALFLNIKVAFWVAIGIPISIVASFTFMPMLAIPINMVTLFAFILTLGVLVDDAVVVAEKINANLQSGMQPNAAIKKAMAELTQPLLVAVATNILAFLPLFFVPGEMGNVYKPMAMLVIAIFSVSLIEALLLLPRHLSSKRLSISARSAIVSDTGASPTDNADKDLATFLWLKSRYAKLLTWSTTRPYMILGLFLSFTLVIFAWAASGRVDVGFIPKYESTRIDAEIVFHPMISASHKADILSQVTSAGAKALETLNGEQALRYQMLEIEGTVASVTFQLWEEEQRHFTASQFVDGWRENLPHLPAVQSLFFDFQVGPGGDKELVIELQHPDQQKLQDTVTLLTHELRQLRGLTDVNSDLLSGNPEYVLDINKFGTQMGLSIADISQQIRRYYWGTELLRQVSDGTEIKIFLKASEPNIGVGESPEQLLINTPGGQVVRLNQVANLYKQQSPSEIYRVDGARTTEITASVLRDTENAIVTFNDIEQRIIPLVKSQFPDVEIELAGEAEEEDEVNANLLPGVLVSLLLIGALLALVYGSYTQTLITLSIIPVAIAGAILGHILLGHALSVMSFFGVIALSGIIINGALFLQLSFLKNSHSSAREEAEVQRKIHSAALTRFRPVLLSALTTAGGLFPLLFETSTQALYLIPMAISLGVGALFSVSVVMLGIPALLTIVSRSNP